MKTLDCGMERTLDQERPRAGVRLFLPFALGYFLSYAFRTVNAVISPGITQELALSAADLGLLTSAYFLSFGLAQIPVGIALDRFGPRRVEGALLLLAALGAAAFAGGDTLAELGLARGLVGLGVSACLMAGLKGFTMWYPREQQSSMTGFIMAAGALGALSASAPLEALLPLLGWRGVFWLLAAAALASALYIFVAVPDEAPQGARDALPAALAAVGGIFASTAFLRFAASAFFFTGGFLALQSLWVVPWLMTVSGLDLQTAAGHLLVLNVGMLCGQLSIGLLATRLARRGVQPLDLIRWGFGLMLLVELAILGDLGPRLLVWFLFGMLSAVNSQSYLATALHFPHAVFGRVSTSVNLMAFVGAFAVQWGLGVALDMLQGGGTSRAAALAIAFTGLIVLQAASFLPLLSRHARPGAAFRD